MVPHRGHKYKEALVRVTGVPLATAHRQCGGALQQFHYPLPPGSVAVHYRSSTARRPQAVWQCIAKVRGNVLLVRLVQGTQCSATRHTVQYSAWHQAVQHSTHSAMSPIDPV